MTSVIVSIENKYSNKIIDDVELEIPEEYEKSEFNVINVYYKNQIITWSI